MTENKSGNFICESCGERFQCGAQTGACWCFEVNLNPELLSEINREYNNCLCRGCIIKKASNALEIELKDC